VRVELLNGGQLLFCAHHAREHEAKLKEIAIMIHDESDRLGDTTALAPDGEF
jgi:hypothetical protein